MFCCNIFIMTTHEIVLQDICEKDCYEYKLNTLIDLEQICIGLNRLTERTLCVGVNEI